MIEILENIRKSDLISIKTILESSGFFNVQEIQVAIELAKDAYKNKSKSEYKFLIAVDKSKIGSTIIGFLCYGLIPCTKASYDIYWIAMHNNFRFQGIGKKLLLECEERIKRLDGKRIYIETSDRPAYESTVQFYLRNKYFISAILDDYYDVGDSKIIFFKSIQEGG